MFESVAMAVNHGGRAIAGQAQPSSICTFTLVGRIAQA
jgi:hypothetical protein